MKIHGSTVHIVDKGDSGTIIAQSAIKLTTQMMKKLLKKKLKN